MKKKKALKVLSEDGEIHFLLREDIADDESGEKVCLEDAEVGAILKKEASKPLHLRRS